MGTVNLVLPSDGDTIDAADVNTPLNALAAVVNGGIDSTNITDGSIVAGDIANDAVTDAKLIFGKLRSRQGGSATDWYTAGTNTYDYSGTDIFMQVGSMEYDGSGNDTVTFPTAFNQVPLVFATASTAVDSNVFVRLATITATNFTYSLIDPDGTGNAERFSWLAIGQ